ncbi:hypothetical protein HMPREF1982_01744 [Clostridiales bacterium oral taxon 876 str. F0540]|nr:hypothetical protein HMPREF1982_01744 [Clostridiales bacterium oral taxon 876 str. F0540]
MKVIFLDVDGVLNSEEFLKNNPDKIIDRNNVRNLKSIIDKTGAAIVMSSGWKLWFDDDMMPIHKYSQCLYDILTEFDIKLFGKTPDFTTEEIREKKTFSLVKAKEINAWLSEHENASKYVVLDDLDLGNEEIKRRLVRTNPMYGITETDARVVISMMGIEM